MGWNAASGLVRLIRLGFEFRAVRMKGWTLLADAGGTAETVAKSPLVEDPIGLLAILLSVLAAIFWASSHPTYGKIFKIIPSLVFCYFVPTLLTTMGVIPDHSPLYSWIKTFLLPAALLLLILALDVPGIIRLGPKAVIMLLAGTAGIVVGGPLALLLVGHWLEPEIWRGMAALSGSWIGGGANFVAIGQAADCSSEMLALMVIPDVLVASIWMGTLLYMSGKQHRIDAWTGANASMIRDLEERMTAFQERVTRVASLGDLLLILALGFVGCWASYALGIEFQTLVHKAAEAKGALAGLWEQIDANISATTWKFILVTTIGICLSFTRARNLEGAGASKIGSVMIYLLVACIGASADFTAIIEQPALVLAGVIWILVHVAVLLFIGWLIKAPIFFVAVGSQANIGGAASAPVVAAAFHPSLAPVGALLAVAGYVLGTYAGLLCMYMLRSVAGVVHG